MADNTYISFYLKSGTIHIFRDTIRFLDTPRFVQFRVHPTGNSMLLLPYPKKTFTSLRVPENVYDENGGMRVHSKSLCSIIAVRMGWNIESSYRIPGKMIRGQGMVLFDLSRAVVIHE